MELLLVSLALIGILNMFCMCMAAHQENDVERCPRVIVSLGCVIIVLALIDASFN